MIQLSTLVLMLNLTQGDLLYHVLNPLSLVISTLHEGKPFMLGLVIRHTDNNTVAVAAASCGKDLTT